ncbi:putative intracellular protease/amidase [Peptoniphilus ivorii]|uniref:DJ-1/PfpI family protein n=1 Tax=Aedoeadaptatus ivorii TaxID=54006 RepID=UPI00277EC659|nr:DJ-1/PfpI family protein [Peptoniphilus ivorii]MDQ0508204.1 putative intracellular protease/amidase [Peptoniphilus ivorii]
MNKICVLLFDDFETLDAFGPVQVFGRMNDRYTLRYVSFEGGIKVSRQGARIETEAIDDIALFDILLVPGGMGTRELIRNVVFIRKLREVAQKAANVLTVCTGSALLAKTGLLDGKEATSNKMAWDWVISTNAQVNWQSSARWSISEKYYTASGISAGIDMALGFVADHHGVSTAEAVAREIEYIWNRNPDTDPFAVEKE